MTAPVSGCSAWAQVEDIPSCSLGMHSPERWCAYLSMATDVLWSATGRRWRGANLTAEAVLRAAPPRVGEGAWPYHRSWGQCACFAGTGLLGPTWSDGVRGHHEPVAVRLPHPDVTAVTSVLVDGAPFAAWQLDGAWISRTDGHGWPSCHDRTVVAYRFGKEPPPAGKENCVELALELGRASSSEPDKPCSLPRRLQSVTRQGITFAALDDMEFLDDGLTGLYSIDVWIKAVNPYGRKQQATVWSPDLPRARRTR